MCFGFAHSLAGRVAYCGQFAAQIKGCTPNGETYKRAAVVIGPKHIATYQHSDHDNEDMLEGQDVEVNYVQA